MTIPHLRQALPLLTLALLMGVLSMAAGCGSRTEPAASGAPTAVAAGEPWAAQLPALGDLPAAPQSGRKVSVATPYNLLNNAPVASSAGANWSQGSLTLIPDLNGGIAWAIFGIGGFDPGIHPQSIAGDKGGPLWVGLPRYGDQRWEWRRITANNPNPWTSPHGTTTGFVSPTNATYVAIIKLSAEDPFARTMNALTLTASDALFAPPVASLAVTSPRPTASYAVSFDFSASAPGDGNITTVTFTPDTGETPISLTPGDLAVPQTFTYAAGGSKTATLELLDDLGSSDTAQLTFTVADTFKELLVVFNSDIPESADLASYYMAADTGRGIDPAYQLGLPLGAAVGPEVDRPTYESTIRDPIKAFLDASSFKSSLKYILLLKGIPHRISGVEGFSGDLNDTTCSAVDSELCTLYADGAYENKGCLWNGNTFFDWDSTGFYMGREPEDDYSFTTGTHTVTDENSLNYALSYLVGRITGYSYADAKASIDRSLAADTSGTGWVIFDSSDALMNPGPPPLYQWDLDTMVDPVFPELAIPIDDSGYDLLFASGYNVFADSTTATLDAGDVLPPGFVNSVIGYAGWGVNSAGGGFPSGPMYIDLDLGWNYLPGACFMSYESFNGSASDPDIVGAARRGQGQILDFIAKGGTVAIGNVFEPYALAVGDERIVFYRYLVKGDRWIEAAYKGMRLLSWQEIVVGDPLCRVKP